MIYETIIVMIDESLQEVKAQEWIVRFDGKIKRSEKTLYVKTQTYNKDKIKS